MMLKYLLARCSSTGPRARLSTLVLHRVLHKADPLRPDDMDAMAFERMCRWLRSHFNVLSLTDAVHSLNCASLPERALCITFDDGYVDNLNVVLPILQRYGLTATFFVTTGTLDGGWMWNDVLGYAVRGTPHESLALHGLELPDVGLEIVQTPAQRLALVRRLTAAVKYLPPARRDAACAAIAKTAGVDPPRDLMLSGEQVRVLHRAGMGIGSHTRTHPILAGLEPDDVLGELLGSRLELEQLLDAPVELLAYPNGKWGRDVDTRCVQLARESGYHAALTTEWGAADHATHPMLLPRFTPWDRTRLAFMLRMAYNMRLKTGTCAPMCRAASGTVTTAAPP